MKKNKLRVVITENGVTYDTSKAKFLCETGEKCLHRYYKKKDGTYFEIYQVAKGCYSLSVISKTIYECMTRNKSCDDTFYDDELPF